jgi:hypothetical protein
MSVTNWERLESRMGPNEEFPGRQVYCYGAFRNMQQDWFVQFTKEADKRGMEVLVSRGSVFVLKEEAING